MEKKFKVGFIGLGLMGKLMAKNIHRAGFPLTIYNRTKSKTSEFAEMGVPVATSPSDLAKGQDVVITMVTGPRDVKGVLLGENGVANKAKRGLVVIDMSTIGPQTAKEISLKLARKGIEFLDAPVTGSTPKAETGELTIFVGGKKRILEKVKPLLLAMGKKILFMGPVGSGQAVKLVNNHLVGATVTALAESLILADAQNLSRRKVATALAEAPVMSPFMNLKLPLLLKHQFAPLFSLANMAKDLNLAQDEAKKAKKRLPVLETVARLYNEGLKLKLANCDNAAILKVLEKKN